MVEQMACASRAAALRCNQVVERIDLGIEHREGPLAVSVVGANRGSLSRFYRVKKNLAVSTATIRLLSRHDPARARDRGGGSSSSHIGFLPARRASIGGKGGVTSREMESMAIGSMRLTAA
jgi:hypothetical protein